MKASVSSRPSRLLIVYNADGGILNSVKDAVHKLVSPSTYPCSLCAITYGAVSMHGDWKRFVASLPIEVVFHHKDDFAQAYPEQDIDLPAILISRDDMEPRVLILASELDAIANSSELIARVKKALATV